MGKQLKIFVHPVDAAGHINACIGVAQALAKRGHQIHFLASDAFAGQFQKFGFQEILLRKQTSPVNGSAVHQSNQTEQENPIKLIAQQLLDTGILSDKSPLEKSHLFKDNIFFKEVYETTLLYHEQLEQAIKSEQPDLVIIDHFIVPPCILYGQAPWMTLFSGNPLGLYESPDLPPIMYGLPTNDRTEWEKHRKALDEYFIGDIQKYQNSLLAHFNYPKVNNKSFLTKSKYLNIYGYPKELDYDDIVPMPEKFFRVDAFCREIPEPFELPAEFKAKIKQGDKLIYISLGSMGSVDVKLMKRIVSALANTEHKYIVSKGPLGDQYELPDNMWGEAYLPQTSILPLVDLVITHGGNNTVTETFSFGKPMIVMPLFADQYDNAQRLLEKGFGVRLETYRFTNEQLVNAIATLLANKQMQQELKSASDRIQQSNSKEQLAIKIEQICEQYSKK